MPQSNEVDGVRLFNRFYTRRMGLLDEGLLASPFTLTEVRVLYELARRGTTIAAEIGGFLGLDAAYLSRIIKRFEERGLVGRRRSRGDGRAATVRLTEAGCIAFAPLDRAAAEEVAGALANLPESERVQLLQAMAVIRRVLGDLSSPAERSVRLREHRPGDIGWAIERHGALYAQEFGWLADFEALVAKILGAFLEDHDAKSERCWIATVDGERAGCVFLVKSTDVAGAAQLRCLLVEPWARGLGLGRQLVDACIGLAREAPYRCIVLWTNNVLVSARRIYQAAGFELVDETRHHSFGHDLVGQTWRLEL